MEQTTARPTEATPFDDLRAALAEQGGHLIAMEKIMREQLAAEYRVLQKLDAAVTEIERRLG